MEGVLLSVYPKLSLESFFRGVSKGHLNEINALNGRVEPGDVNSSVTATAHNEGSVSH